MNDHLAGDRGQLGAVRGDWHVRLRSARAGAPGHRGAGRVDRLKPDEEDALPGDRRAGLARLDQQQRRHQDPEGGEPA